MRVLMIDGPRAGDCYDLPDDLHTFHVDVIAADVAKHQPNLMFETVVYRIVPKAVWLFGGYINCGTVSTGQPSKEDLIKVLLSDAAKEALT